MTDEEDVIDSLMHATPESLISIAIVVAGLVAKRWLANEGKRTITRIGRRTTDMDCATLTKDVEDIKAALVSIEARLTKVTS